MIITQSNLTYVHYYRNNCAQTPFSFTITRMPSNAKLNAYYFTAIISLIFAIVGFSYNAWRLEISEDNANIRTAAFQVLIELAEFEQILYAAHYDKDTITGNPRKGWIKVGLITDMSILISPAVEQQAQNLKSLWSERWDSINTDKQTIDLLNKSIDNVRDEIKMTLQALQ